MTTTRTRITALALAAILLTGACSNTPEEAPEPEVTPTVEATTAAEPEETAVVEETPAADEPDVPVGVGETVPADQIEAARAEGASVYVSPNGNGDGIVIEPGVTPDVLVDDVSEYDGSTPRSMTEFAEELGVLVYSGEAAAEANTGVFILMTAPSFESDGSVSSWQYVVEGIGAIEGPLTGADFRRSTKEEAIAAFQPVMDANPGLVLVDRVG